MNARVKILFLLCTAMMISSCTKEEKEVRVDASELHSTMDQITKVIVHDIFSPPVASRIYAYSSIAAYEAAIPGDPQYASLAGQLNGLESMPKPDPSKKYLFELASVHALATVGQSLIFSEQGIDTFHTATLEKYRRLSMPDDLYENSIEFGGQVAAHILEWASKDNYKQTRTFEKYTVPVNEPGKWKPTPPAYMDGIEPHWNKIRPFVLDSANQFTPNPPTPFSTSKDSKFHKEAMEVYEAVKNGGKEPSDIAFFWDCNPYVMNVRGHVMFATKKITPGGHWMGITKIVCSQQQLSLAQSAEAYALVSIALADGFISCWDEKYRSNLVRPETYINQFVDENWLPLLQTPPFPEHTSGHSVISTAAATTLTELFGANIHFVDSTEVDFGLPPRSFNSFLEASSEAAISRLYGGIHYRPAIDEGVIEGRKVGEWVINNIRTKLTNESSGQ